MTLHLVWGPMCGRYSLFAPREDIEERFDARCAFDYEPTYNAAPGQQLPVVTDEAPDTVRTMQWGLVPAWWDDDTGGLINARAETVAEKPSFRDAYERRRCLVPADGFYEWVERDGGSRPYRVARPDDDLFAMAGLYERWTPDERQAGLADFGGGVAEEGEPEPLETFTVVTTEPNDVVADLHDRMAVVLTPAEEAAWLAGEDVPLDPYGGELCAYEVSTAVNDPSNDFPQLVEPV